MWKACPWLSACSQALPVCRAGHSLVSPVGWALRTGRLLACCAWVTAGSLDCQEETACDPRGQLTAGVPDFEPSQKDSWVYFLM